MVWIETPTIPKLNIYDIKKIIEKCKDKDIITVFDNTLFTPFLMNPIEFGVDIILHSGSKFLSGHSDIMMGFISTNNENIYKRLSVLYPRKLIIIIIKSLIILN